MIANKLDLLMKITGTSNSVLGSVLFFDPSYVGRIRAGKRGLPKSQPFVEPVAEYFAKSVTDEFQRRTLADLICNGESLPEDVERTKELIMEWLAEDSDSVEYDGVVQLLKEISSFTGKPSGYPIVAKRSKEEQKQVTLFYGNEGKRESAVEFFRDLCSMSNPPEVYICTDEDFGWTLEDPLFMKKWNSLLTKYISLGGRIKIIHTPTNNTTAMLDSLRTWWPLYMSGEISPYYYPKLRDGIYRRTLLVAKDHSAVTSSSVKAHTQNALSALIFDENAAKSIESEFNDYLMLCKPLMRVYKKGNCSDFVEAYRHFNTLDASCISFNCSPSLSTMPLQVVQSMADRVGDDCVKEMHACASSAVEALVSSGKTYTEVLQLPSVRRVESGKVAVPMSDLIGYPAYYTKEELVAHLENMVNLLRKYDNFNVVLTRKSVDGVMVKVMENVGLVLAGSNPPTTLFNIWEDSLTTLFWDYLNDLVGKAPVKSKTIEQLERYVAKLKG